MIAGLDARLPFSVDDANRPETDARPEAEARPEAGDSEEVQYKRVLLETRLNNRVIDLRVGYVFQMPHCMR